MSELKSERDLWYAARDDRTGRNQQVGNFHQVSVAIIVDPNCEENYDLQVSLVVAANILSRWCRRVSIEMPESPSVLFSTKGQSLQSVVLGLMKGADPYGEFSCGPVDENEFDHILLIGEPARVVAKPATWVRGSGWLAGVGLGVSPSFIPVGRNVVGPAFAACLGVAEIFKLANGLSQPAPYASWVSLFDYKQSTAAEGLQNPEFYTDGGFGIIDVIGCGAIGSSYVGLVGLTDIPAHFRLIDFDPVSAPNCSSSLVFSRNSAKAGVNKTEACADYLRESRITCEKFNGSYSQFVATGVPFDLPADLILCFANEQNVWATIQKNMPPLVLHATTTSSWGLNFGRHLPGLEWCILCRFGNSETGFRPPCAVGEVAPVVGKSEPVLASLPFLSPASAAIALAETMKSTMRAPRDVNNFLEFSMKKIGSRGRFMRGVRVPEPACACRSQPLTYYPDAVRKTRYWPADLARHSVQSIKNGMEDV